MEPAYSSIIDKLTIRNNTFTLVYDIGRVVLTSSTKGIWTTRLEKVGFTKSFNRVNPNIMKKSTNVH